jgi:hypothetical protein
MTTAQLGTIENVDIRKVWKDEARDFTPWLADHISQLGDALGLNLEFTPKEEPIGSFKLDILARDADRDFAVAIENQMGETDHSHLGQLVTYAAGCGAQVGIWIAGKFRDEHREAVDMLNHRTGRDSEYYGVVVELLKIGDSLPAPHFRVVSAPNDWGKEQRQVREDGELSLRYRQFFQALVDQAGDGADIPRPYRVRGRSWQSFKTGRSGFGYGASFSSMEGGRARINLYIDCGDQ